MDKSQSIKQLAEQLAEEIIKYKKSKLRSLSEPISRVRKAKRHIGNIGYINIKCPSCSNVFGLDSKFINKTSEINMRYNCPYCSDVISGVNQ